MMFYMDSHTFLTKYLENEEDWVILDTYYAVVSLRVHTDSNQHNGMIINCSALYPDSSVWAQDAKKDYRAQYFHQLDKAKASLATLVKGSIKKDFNFVFLCSKNENRSSYLKYLGQYIENTFYYPVYDYREFMKGKTPIYKYDEDQVLRICKSVLKEREKEDKINGERPYVKRAQLVDWPKKKLKAELKKYGIYVTSDETRTDMILMLRDII